MFLPSQAWKNREYIDNVSLLNLREPPQSLIIIGGGYIGCEYGHFFSAVGTEVTILGRSPRLLSGEDPEISQRLHEETSPATAGWSGGLRGLIGGKEWRKKVVSARETKGQIQQFEGEEVLLAAGRRS